MSDLKNEIKQKLIAARANVRELEDQLREASAVGWLAIIELSTKRVDYFCISNELPTPIDTEKFTGGSVRLGQDRRLWIKLHRHATESTMPFKKGHDKFGSDSIFFSNRSRKLLESTVEIELTK